MKFIGLAAIAMCLGMAPASYAMNNSTAAHYAIHAMEKLVGQGKLEEAFQTAFQNMTVQADANTPTFTVVLRQIPGVDKTARAVELTMNILGQMTSYTLVDGAIANNPPIWPDADAHELGEDAMHYLLDNVETHPELVPFDKDMAGLTLSQSSMVKDGMVMAVAEITSSSSKDTLRIVEDTSGVVQSAAIVNP